MGAASPPDVTGLLQAWSNGDEAALESLIPLVDAELRRIAARYLEREPPEASLQTTELVNEAYLRLIDARRVEWRDRAHFFAVCARLMRRILVDLARDRWSAKRGAGRSPLALDEALAVSWEPASDLVAIDDALNGLAKIDPRKGQVVEMRFFGGLSVEETAEVLKVSPQTVLRDWRLARAWLFKELSREDARDASSMATG
ncbi:MAG: sigma-70 family RNA polymerase sigma factor [Acidobacteria bacterium]|nr:sigma-70 family RNA polymerase sigma factor [Acidobacteriota bacterium]